MRLELPYVTLCAVSGYLVPQTIEAMKRAEAVAKFGEKLLIVDRQPDVPVPADIRIVAGADLNTREKYSRVVQQDLGHHVTTPFAMIVQWDGYPTRPENWTDAFYDYDYVGAPWQDFPAFRAVGNGGFSLRSQKLLRACQDPRFVPFHPEDIGICHKNRAFLEETCGIRFAPLDVAARFSFERRGERSLAFGFHGLFNMPQEMGAGPFMDFFAGLDRSSIGFHELRDLREALKGMPDAAPAMSAILRDLLKRHWQDSRLWRYLLLGRPGPVP